MADGDLAQRISELSPERRALLARRLRTREAVPAAEPHLQRLEGEALAARLAYWRPRLAGLLPDRGWSPDAGRLDGQRAGRMPVDLPAPVLERARSIAARDGGGLLAPVLAALAFLLHRYTGRSAAVVGCPVLREGPGAGPAPGLVLLPVPVRGAESAADLLERARQAVDGAREHGDLPIGQLAEELGLGSDAARGAPLFQVLLSVQEGGSGPAGSPGLRCREPLPAERCHGLELVLRDVGGAVSGELRHGGLDAAAATRLREHFLAALRELLAEPAALLARLPLLGEGERHQLCVEWNRPGAGDAGRTLVDLLAERAGRDPDAVAFEAAGERITFGELARRAGRWALALQAGGIGPEDRVALCCAPSGKAFAAGLGVLAAGAAWVPLDPRTGEERRAAALSACRPKLLLTGELLDLPEAPASPVPRAGPAAAPQSAAFVLPAGGPAPVVLPHAAAVRLLRALGEGTGTPAAGTWLIDPDAPAQVWALEGLWPLAGGGRVRMAPSAREDAPPRPARRRIGLSLFFFTGDGSGEGEDKYRLLIESARFADRHGFTAVWTPERHFHAFGGLYPNPSVAAAALAMVTSKIRIRAGSVVLPLHHPLRVAEEWALVDNLSRGRVDVAFASGWHPNDFVFAPDAYGSRREETWRQIETIRTLWAGGTVDCRTGTGGSLPVRVYPKPLQPRLPVWITSGGSPETFAKAGELGANVLTNLLGQTLEGVAENVRTYREALARHGHDPEAGCATLMLHAFVGDSVDAVRNAVRGPFLRYLRTFTRLLDGLAGSERPALSASDLDLLLSRAFDRYFETAALFGTPEICLDMIDRLRGIGIDEVACLIDFGVDEDLALSGLRHLDELRRRAADESPRQVVPAMLREAPAGVLRCAGPRAVAALAGNGEAPAPATVVWDARGLPASALETLRQGAAKRLVPAYGPPEGGGWTAAGPLGSGDADTVVGRPLAGAEVLLLDREMRPVPVGVPGEVWLGGDGLARGYGDRPDLTAERFVPHPFGREPGARLFRSGDLGRWLPSGRLEFLGPPTREVGP